MKYLYLQIRRFVLSLFMHYGQDEPTHLKEVKTEWMKGIGYGVYHPRYPYEYWDNSGDKYDKEVFDLYYRYNPRTFNDINITWEKQVIRSSTEFKRGFFKFDVFRDAKPHTWDAIWLAGDWSWPPEADLIEWYGKKAKSNFHEMRDGGYQLGQQRHKPAKTYSCWWEKDFIRFYYGGFLVREFKDMKYFNIPMRIIINTGCESSRQVQHEMIVFPQIYQ